MASAFVFGALRDEEPPRAGREPEEETDSMEQESCEAGRDLPGLPGFSQVEETPEMRMFRKVISSNRIIKSQQRDEPDLTSEQKVKVLDDLLQKKPGAFLMRFGQLLDATDLTFFDAQKNYEIEFRVKQLRKNLSSKARKKQTRNRRYTALMELADTSQYFSDQEMRERNPMLFEEYIGQYLTEEEKASLDSDKSEMSLSAHIMKKMDIDKRRELLRRQRRELKESAVEEEEEEEEDSSSEDERESETVSSDAAVTAQEKWMMRQEFLRVMQLNFLAGEDRDFDYSKVDLNEKYDSLEMRQRDEEDSYFDAEEPSLCEEDDGGKISRDSVEEGCGGMDDQ